jgi:hypothetical protein
MLRDFASCLQDKLARPETRDEGAAQEAKPVRGISLFFSVLFERLRRLFTRRR